MMQTIFGIPGFGILVALGTLTTYFIAHRLGKREGLDPEVVVDVTLIIMIGGIVGCRALHVIDHWADYRQMPWVELLRIDKGGLHWYGCFFTILPASYLYFRRSRLDPWAMIDLFTIFVVLAQAFGRLGCFLNGCCWGRRLDPDGPLGWLAVRFPTMTPAWAAHVKESLGQAGMSVADFEAAIPHLPGALRDGSYPVFPVQVFMSVAGVALTVFFLWYFGRHKRTGQAFAATFSLFALSRFGFEMLRADEVRGLFGLTESQWISLGCLAFGVTLFWVRGRWGQPYLAGASGVPIKPAAGASVEVSGT